MASATAALSAPVIARPRSAACRWRVTLLRDWEVAAPRWQAAREAGAAGTLFQTVAWLESFYAAIRCDAGIEPLIVWMEDAQSGDLALALPLVRRQVGRLHRIEFADLGMTDFNTPLLGPAAPRAGKEAARLWAALRRALPPADQLLLQKMPPMVEDRVNPLAHLPGAHDCAVNGNLITVGEDYDAWRFTLPRTVRKELERSWRVFTRHPDTAFGLIEDPQEALRVLEVMEEQQRARLAELGEPYKLGDPVTMALHRELLARHAASGFAALGVLTAGEEIVAALLGIREGDTLVLIRLTHIGSKWATSSPGRLILSRMMGELHARGVRKFDFSVGNFAYKRRFGPVRQPMVDLGAVQSWRGLSAQLRLHAGAVLRRHPQLRHRLRRALGKRVSREED